MAYRYRHGWIPLFHSDQVADDFRSKMTLSKHENRALYRWTGTGASLINGHLRGGRGTDDGAPDAEAMTALARRYQLPGSANGFRALGDNVLPEGDQAGKVITAPGFSSVALDKPAGGEFSDPRRYPVMMELYIPEGTNGIAVEGTEHAFPDQREFILPHNSRFAIEEDRMVGGVRQVKATVLPPADSAPEEPAPPRNPTPAPAAAGYDDGPFSPDAFGGL